MKPIHDFLRTAGRVLNSGQARTIMLTGNIHDLFAAGDGEYVSLVDLLSSGWSVPGKIIVVYELNGPLRFRNPEDREKLRAAWLQWRTGRDANETAIKSMLSHGRARAEIESMGAAFDANMINAVGNPTVALEFLRQLCLCSRTKPDGHAILPEDLIVIVEAADMLVPEGEISRLSDADRHRISICHDWFGDPGFMNGNDAAVLISESRSLVNQRIARLPQIVEISVPAPSHADRLGLIDWFEKRGLPPGAELQTWGTRDDLARLTAGLSLHALLQLLKGAVHEKRALCQADVIAKIEDFIQSQLGDDVVEFKKPGHSLNDVIGFSKLKKFIRDEMIPRFRADGAWALSGAAVCGPIGGGKTFIFEAVAGELGMVVLVLKNIRNQWFGQTDVIFERLRRVLDALSKVLIFVDEADTQFGGVGAETHSTERRLTGKIQAMMSDQTLRGKVAWLLMTARINLLSPDIRRPGRVGSLIIPVLDPQGADRDEFLRWTIGQVLDDELSDERFARLSDATAGYGSANFAALRSELRANKEALGRNLSFDEVLALIGDILPPAIDRTRRYQELQALVNCTRRSLLPDPGVSNEARAEWFAEIRKLEQQGIQ